MKRQTAIILTVVAALLCGCPGVIMLCSGSFFALASMTPGAQIDIFGSNSPQSALIFGAGLGCIGLLGLLIPIVVGFVTLRRKDESTSIPAEPLPPTA
jgi:ABC-type branched-subunit amino acid transport system permease subunit